MRKQKPRVLIVEDEVFIAMDLAETLEEAGYRVLGPAHSVKEAMALLDTGVPDAALLDVNLGRETVWPLAQKLAAKRVPMVFATADIRHPELYGQFAAHPRLDKPVRGSSVLSVLKSSLEAAA
jgi:CheY-like chemotaxis protein